ncbi:contractile injection system tape measure protein [Nannocystaceae bacterium ST9]
MATHRINRLELEISVESAEQGQALIDRLSLLHERRIAPLIDRVCSELSGPERLDRIDELELELGTIAIDRFDEEFMRALEAALRAALARKLAQLRDPTRASERPESAALELLDGFARTGNLPWSADRRRADLIPSTIDVLLHHAPERWLGLLHALHDDRIGLARLALHCDDARIEAIAERVGLARARWLAELAELERWILEPIASGSSRVAREQVRVAWLAALGRTSSAPTSAAVLHSTLHGLFALAPKLLDVARHAPTFTSARLQVAFDEVRRGEPALDESPLVDARLVAARPESPLEAASDDAAFDDAGANDEPRGDEPRVDKTHRDEPTRDVETTRDDPRVDELHDDQARGDEPTDEARGDQARGDEPRGDQPRGDQPRGDQPRGDQPRGDQPRGDASEIETPDQRSRAAGTIDADAPARDEIRERPRLARLRPTDPPSLASARRRALERLEQLEVIDAGLVILWPFLERFFLRVGLLDLDRRFVDDSAAAQAIALLSQLAIEDPEPPEYLLPLAKLLCGRAPEAEARLLAPLATEAVAECDHLLRAVIGNAPVLRDMSIAGFRASFLQRQGLLSVREGTWLLQVERQPHDLVLERFPWSWSWVRLPWMTDPLRVDW